jgi:hypothetical protein
MKRRIYSRDGRELREGDTIFVLNHEVDTPTPQDGYRDTIMGFTRAGDVIVKSCNCPIETMFVVGYVEYVT